MSEYIPMYDLESLNEAQRQDYIKAVCKHMGIPDNLGLVALTHIDDGEGPARLVAYAKRGATENVRNNKGIQIKSLTNQMIGGSIVFTATAVDSNGRQEISTGSKYINELKGIQLDDAIMTAQTRALRRVTLQFVGAGVLDESEVHTGKTVQFKQPGAVADLTLAQPTVKPNDEPGQDITKVETTKTVVEYKPVDTSKLTSTVIDHVKGTVTHSDKPDEDELPHVDQDALRAEALAFLNAKHVETVKARKVRTVRKKVDLGPSEIVSGKPPAAEVKIEEKDRILLGAVRTGGLPSELELAAKATEAAFVSTEEKKAMVEALVSPKPAVSAVVETPVKTETKGLTAEQVKPYRQRLFKLVSDHLEPNGFAPKEGVGNSDKMRLFAQVMFPDVANLKELSAEQWEKYLTALEKKNSTEGPQATIRYIEDTIGI